jgi:hypothetical protein
MNISDNFGLPPAAGGHRKPVLEKPAETVLELRQLHRVEKLSKQKAGV